MLLTMAVVASTQTQQGYVKTKGRLATEAFPPQRKPIYHTRERFQLRQLMIKERQKDSQLAA